MIRQILVIIRYLFSSMDLKSIEPEKLKIVPINEDLPNNVLYLSEFKHNSGTVYHCFENEE